MTEAVLRTPDIDTDSLTGILFIANSTNNQYICIYNWSCSEDSKT